MFLRLAISASIVPGSQPGRDHEVGLRAGDHALDGGGVDRAVERDDAAERGALVALERALVRGGEVVGDRDAARVGVLDDGDRGPADGAEVVHEAPRGVGVVEVEVAEREAAVLLDVVPPARRAR